MAVATDDPGRLETEPAGTDEAAVTIGGSSPTEPGGAAPTRGFRPDVDALRAVAIVLVVAYHAHTEGFEGGFVGVDVFFVISGFLITRNLLVERDGNGSISLGRFWARRLRRLVPAMSVMVVATVAVGVLVLPPLTWSALGDQATSASLYWSNLHFARQANDYFAAAVDSSPLLHTWSLSVEEQFYVVWPALVALALALGVRLRRLGRLVLGAAFLVVGVASFALSVSLVDEGSSQAFYGLPSRAWEFAAAGLLALAAHRLRFRLPAVPALVLAGGGLAAILWATTTFTEATRFPGANALVPVLGTIAVIAAGTWSQVTWKAAVAPLQWLGRLSYSWYLWHWPAMVLAVAHLGRDTANVRLVAGLVSLPVAMASYRFVEEPVRRHRSLVPSVRATVAVAAVFTVGALLSVGLLAWNEDRVLSSPYYRDLVEASNKDYLGGCTIETTEAGDEVCVVGDLSAKRSIVVAGDSHAMQWVPSLELVGRDLGYRILVRTDSNCPGVPVRVLGRTSGRLDRKCVQTHLGTDRLIDEANPDLVVLTSADSTRRLAGDGDVRVTGRTAQLRWWADALAGMRDRLAEDGVPLAVILDNPRMYPEDVDPLTCVQRHDDADACAVPRDVALGRVQAHIDNELATVGPNAAFEVANRMCDEARCVVRLDDRFVFSDSSHLSGAYTRDLAPDLAEWIQAQLTTAGS